MNEKMTRITFTIDSEIAARIDRLVEAENKSRALILNEIFDIGISILEKAKREKGLRA